eukprot:3357305-Rhodomonas_salina.2
MRAPELFAAVNGLGLKLRDLDAEPELHLLQKVLLQPDDAARADQPHPRDGLLGRESLAQDHPQRDHGAGVREPRGTVHRADRLLARAQELPHHLVRRQGGGARQVGVLEAGVEEALLVVPVWCAESNHVGHTQLSEQFNVGLDRQCRACCVGLAGPSERDKLGAHHVQISFGRIATIEDSKRKCRPPVACVAKRNDGCDSRCWLYLVFEHQECGEQEDGVRHTVCCICTVIDDGPMFQALVLQEAPNVVTELDNDPNIDWTKVIDEWGVGVLQIC